MAENQVIRAVSKSVQSLAYLTSVHLEFFLVLKYTSPSEERSIHAEACVGTKFVT